VCVCVCVCVCVYACVRGGGAGGGGVRQDLVHCSLALQRGVEVFSFGCWGENFDMCKGGMWIGWRRSRRFGVGHDRMEGRRMVWWRVLMGDEILRKG
jgi:hypothetical protein